VYSIEDEQGGSKGESMDGPNGTSDSMVSNVLFGIGGGCAGRALAAE
jgi:hypothetical protein